MKRGRKPLISGDEFALFFFFAIAFAWVFPSRSASVSALATTPTLLPTITVHWTRRPTVIGAGTPYPTLNPNRTPCPLVSHECEAPKKITPKPTIKKEVK